MLERIIQAYLVRKAGPVVQLDSHKFPYYFEPKSRGDSAGQYWKFHDEHEVELTSKEKRALSDYQSVGYRNMNWYLRNNEHHPEVENNEEEQKRIEDRIEHLNAAIDKSWMRKPVVLWRGIRPSKNEPLWGRLQVLGSGKMPDAKDIHKLVGYKFTEPGFASTSLSQDMTQHDRLRLKIVLEKGQRGLLLNSSYAYQEGSFDEGWKSGYADEHEVLLPAGTEFEVVAAQLLSSSKAQVTVRVVD